MTTIAYRSGIIAADSQVTWRGGRDGSVLKIRKRGPVLAACSGCAARGRAFLDWFQAGMQSYTPDMGPPDDGRHAWGYLFPGGDLVLELNLDGWTASRQPFFASGSGAEYATGAMQVGATAEEAVRAAMVWDVSTGGEITVLKA